MANGDPQWWYDEYVHGGAQYKFNHDYPETANSIVLNAGGDEMLRVAPDGFYVRGVKIEQDAREAQAVYNAFTQWLAWAQLNKGY